MHFVFDITEPLNNTFITLLPEILNSYRSLECNKFCSTSQRKIKLEQERKFSSETKYAVLSLLLSVWSSLNDKIFRVFQIRGNNVAATSSRDEATNYFLNKISVFFYHNCTKCQISKTRKFTNEVRRLATTTLYTLLNL